MSDKLFSFNASSFHLEPAVESFLRSRGCIYLDFGSSAYINSELIPAILSGLMSASTPAGDAGAKSLASELEAAIAERGKVMQQNNELRSQIQSYGSEVERLKKQALDMQKTLDELKAENARLQAAKNQTPVAFDDRMKQAYEKLQKEFQALRAQNIEAITSLKVLEQENEELHEELDRLKGQAKPVAKA